MGKRKKSSRGPAKKIVQKLDTKFNCLFCNHDKAVTCALDKKNSIGTLNCKICGQNFQTRINSLSQPVDVYSDWFDAVEEVNQGQVSDSDQDSGSSSDYESDSDAETRPQLKASQRMIDPDEDDLDDEQQIRSTKRGGATLMDSDDDDDDDD